MTASFTDYQEGNGARQENTARQTAKRPYTWLFIAWLPDNTALARNAINSQNASFIYLFDR